MARISGEVWTGGLRPPFLEGIRGRTSRAGRQPPLLGLASRREQPRPLLLKYQDASGEKKNPTGKKNPKTQINKPPHAVFAKWVFHAEGFCCCCSPGSREFTGRSSGSCVTSRARERKRTRWQHTRFNGNVVRRRSVDRADQCLAMVRYGMVGGL